MHIRILSILFLLTISNAVIAQTKPIKVYLLGTFHFNQTDTLKYDVRSAVHQESIGQLAAKIIKVKPSKVFVERMPEFEYTNKMDSNFQEYKKDKLRRNRNEIWQVGARVAAALGHEHIYQCDHPGMFGSIRSKLVAYNKAHGEEYKLDYKGKGMTTPLTTVMNYDSLRYTMSLIDFMRWMNSREVQRTSHAAYINVYPQIGHTNVFTSSPDYFLGTSLTADWYRRNLLIYSKMLAQLDYTEESIFLIIGNDHVPIIRQLFKDNPYFEVVETEKWLGKSRLR